MTAFVRSSILLALLTAGCKGPQPPIPPPVEISPEAIAAAVRAWPAFAPVAQWDPQFGEAEGVAGEPPRAVVPVALTTPAERSPSGRRYRVPLRLVVDLDFGIPIEPMGAVIADVVQLVDQLPAIEREAAVSRFFETTRPTEQVIAVALGADARCVTWRAHDAAGPDPTLTWCPDRGVQSLVVSAQQWPAQAAFDGLAGPLAAVLAEHDVAVFRFDGTRPGGWSLEVTASDGRRMVWFVARDGDRWHIARR